MRVAFLLAAVLALAGCGDSPTEAAVGRYATYALGAEATQDERDFFGDSLIAKVEELDRREAEGDELLIRLDLKKNGTFEWRGAIAAAGSTDTRMSGRWAADEHAVTLTVASKTDADAPTTMRLSREASGLRVRDLRDPRTGRDALLKKQ